MLQNLLHLFVAFARVGVLGYGGGPSSIPLVQIEAVDNFRWMTVEEFADVLAMGNALPGPIATKMAGYVGYRVAGLLGAAVAVTGLILPSLIAMLVLLRLMTRFKDLPQIGGMIRGVRPVVIVLLLLLVLEMWPKSVTSVTTVAIGVLSFAAIYFLKVHPAVVVVAALAFGAIVLK